MRAPLALALLVCATSTVGTTAAAQGSPAARRAFTPADYYRMTWVSTPALSPDGKRVAFTVQTVRERENARHTEVWVVPTSGGEPVRYTSPSTESSNPRFSADGKYLLFTSQRPGGRGNTWALRMDEPSGEAFQPSPLPAVPQGTQPRDGSFTIVTEGGGGGAFGGGRGGPGTPPTPDSAGRRDDPFAAMPPMARPTYAAVTKPLDPTRFDGRHVTEMGYKSNGPGFIPGPATAPRPQPVRPAQLIIVRGSERKPLTETKYSHRNAVVSPDGRWIAFIADARLRPDSVLTAERDSLARLPYDRKRVEANRNDSDIYILPIAACESRTPECTPRRIEHFGQEANLAWSPDGKQIAFVARPGQFRNARLYAVEVEGAKPREILPASWTYEPGTVRWLRNGLVSIEANTGGSSGVYTVNPATREMKTVLGGRRQVSGVSYDSSESRIVFVSTSIQQPTELHVADADGSNERKLTSFNDRINAEIAWPEAERFTYRSVGNLEVEGWLMKPHGYEPGKKYPMVLYIHGGPHAAYGEGWFDEFHNLAGAGMFVLFTNPRGSSNYNTEFTFSTRGRWGAEDYQDLMKAVDIVAKRPDVDSTRMGVTGGSYGGFMTAWITTRTNRFKAAQADRMISDWISWYGSSDAQGLTEGEFFGRPWENLAMYDTLSPIRFVHKVRTPTLIVQSEEDHRTPMVGAEMWFMALKKLEVPVEFIRYPRSTHDLSRTGEPWLLVDRLGRLRQWFAHWLQNDGRATAAAPR